MQTPSTYLVAIAASAQSIGALTRLLYQLPIDFPALVVAVVHGLTSAQVSKLVKNQPRLPLSLDLFSVIHPTALDLGSAYLVSTKSALLLTAVGTLGFGFQDAENSENESANRLFESAARIYGDQVIGVVLSGPGDDGTTGMLAITKSNGFRIVQTPCEAAQPFMPLNALMRDDIQYSVLLDELGPLLCEITKDPIGARWNNSF